MQPRPSFLRLHSVLRVVAGAGSPPGSTEQESSPESVWLNRPPCLVSAYTHLATAGVQRRPQEFEGVEDET